MLQARCHFHKNEELNPPNSNTWHTYMNVKGIYGSNVNKLTGDSKNGLNATA